MKNQIVLGSFFGDESKGATVQWLCKKALARDEKILVVRFSGGAQCGHRVIYNSIEHVCSSFGSGVLLDVPTYLTENVYVDPISIKNEYEEIYRKTGIKPTLYINGYCRVTTPFDILHNREDSTTLSHGSCGEGIFATFKRYKSNDPSDKICISDITECPYTCEDYINEVADYYNLDTHNQEIKNLKDSFISAVEWFYDKISIYAHGSTNYLLPNHVDFKDYDLIIWEGSQGMLLDMDCGFMPHCTPSKTGLNGIHEKFLKDAEVFLVMRSYLTRHGNGFTPVGEELIRNNYVNLEEPTNEDTGYQGRFKIGAFDLSLLQRLWDRHHLDNYKYHYNVKYNIVMNHLDCPQDKFYYTRDGHSIESLQYRREWVKPPYIVAQPFYIKQLLQEVCSFDNFYAGFKQSELGLV